MDINSDSMIMMDVEDASKLFSMSSGQAMIYVKVLSFGGWPIINDMNLEKIADAYNNGQETTDQIYYFHPSNIASVSGLRGGSANGKPYQFFSVDLLNGKTYYCRSKWLEKVIKTKKG